MFDFFVFFGILEFYWYICQTRQNPEKYWAFQEVTIEVVPKWFSIFLCPPFWLVCSLLPLIEVFFMLIIDLILGLGISNTHCKSDQNEMNLACRWVSGAYMKTSTGGERSCIFPWKRHLLQPFQSLRICTQDKPNLYPVKPHFGSTRMMSSG